MSATRYQPNPIDFTDHAERDEEKLPDGKQRFLDLASRGEFGASVLAVPGMTSPGEEPYVVDEPRNPNCKRGFDDCDCRASSDEERVSIELDGDPPRTVRMSALNTLPSTYTASLARQPGGVSVTDDDGRHLYQLVIPNEPLSCAESACSECEQLADARNHHWEMAVDLQRALRDLLDAFPRLGTGYTTAEQQRCLRAARKAAGR